MNAPQSLKPMNGAVNDIAHLIHSEIGWQNVVMIIGGHEGSTTTLAATFRLVTERYQPTRRRTVAQSIKTHDAETLIHSHIPANS
jgi:hypothetical protein